MISTATCLVLSVALVLSGLGLTYGISEKELIPTIGAIILAFICFGGIWIELTDVNKESRK